MSFSQKQQIQSQLLAQQYGLDVEDVEQLAIARQLQNTRRQGSAGQQSRQQTRQQIRNQLLAQQLGLDVEELEQLSNRRQNTRRQGDNDQQSRQQNQTLRQQIRNQQLAEELGLDLEDLEQLSFARQQQSSRRSGDYDQQSRQQRRQQRFQNQLLTQQFGLDEEDLEQLSISRQNQSRRQNGNSDVAEVVNKGNQSTIKIDLHQFRPQEIEVRARGNILVVRAEHEEREDRNGTVEREFQRKFVLSDNVEQEDIVATVNRNGELKIQVKDNLQQLRQLVRQTRNFDEEFVQLDNNEEEFSVRLDLSQFRPEEIEVKTNGNTVVVHAQHEERVDRYGSVEREIKRKYVLPETVDPEDITTTINKDGVLKIDTRNGPQSQQRKGTGRQIPIQFEDNTNQQSFRPIRVVDQF